MRDKFLKYSVVVLSFFIIWLLSLLSKTIFHSFEGSAEHGLLIVFFLIGLLFALSSIIYHVSRLASVPSFVTAIFFGVLAKPFLEPIVNNHESLSVLVGLGATLILFAGGLETPFDNFKKIMGKIFALSFPGLLVTAFLTSLTAYVLNIWFGAGISIITAVLLGAVLSSTDPAAIIPILRKLKFSNRSVKDIVISESAFTDVTGTLLTIVFLALISGGVGFDKITNWYGAIFTPSSGLVVFKQLFFGILLGVVGYGLLELLLHFKKKSRYSHEADLPFFLFVPIMIFVFSLVFGGSGYLAAFIAGLLFHLTEHLKDTEHFFNNLVEGFFKPTIFILLGALIDLSMLIKYAPVGIALALIFMFVIRPLSVFISLTYFKYFSKDKLSFNDLFFISFVRETGAIPAVLLVTIVSLALPNIEGLLEIGMWVILATLIIAPPLTPKVAKLLKVATPMEDEEDLVLSEQSSVMIVSRGYGFIKRLPLLSDYAIKHNIEKIIVLLCLEEKYTETLEHEIQEAASVEFIKEKQRLNEITDKGIEFQFISRKGMLHDNIDFISEMKDTPVSLIFAGKKMLDYHLSEIKQLNIPIRFIN